MPASNNPYRVWLTEASPKAQEHQDLLRTPGFNFQMIDEMFRRHYRAGFREAENDQEAKRIEEQPRIYDEGYDAGHNDGSVQGKKAAAEAFTREHFWSIRSPLERIIRETRSEAVKEMASDALAALYKVS